MYLKILNKYSKNPICEKMSKVYTGHVYHRLTGPENVLRRVAGRSNNVYGIEGFYYATDANRDQLKILQTNGIVARRINSGHSSDIRRLRILNGV